MAYVQSNGANYFEVGFISATTAFNSANVGGNLIVVEAIIYSGNPGPFVSAVTDSAGNTYSQATVTTAGIYGSSSVWVSFNCASSANTVTFHFNQSCNYITLIVNEYSGTYGAVDVAASTSGIGTALDSGLITPTASNCLLISYGWGSGSTGSLTIGGGGFTQRQVSAASASGDRVSAGGSYNSLWTSPVSGLWVSAIVSIKSAIVLTVQPPTNVDRELSTLNATITALGVGGAATEVGFNWGLTASYGNISSSVGSFSEGPFLIPVPFTEGLVHHYQAFATSVDGTTVSRDYTFQAGVQTPTFVQASSFNGASSESVSATMSSPPAAGNSIIVSLSQYPQTISVTGCSDNAGNVYSVLLDHTRVLPEVYSFAAVCHDIKVPDDSALVVTCTLTTGTTFNTHIDILEYANVGLAGVHQTMQVGGWDANNAIIDNPPITTVTNNELLLACIETDGAPTITPSPGWIARTNTADPGQYGSFAVLEQVAIYPGIRAPLATLSVVSHWSNLVIDLAPKGAFVPVPTLTDKMTPPMGWDAWYTYGFGVSAANIEANADALVSTGLAAAGYNIVEPNGGGYVTNRDINGNLVGSSGIPSMAAVAAYVLSKGLRMGAYCNLGPYGTGCSGFPTVSGYDTIDANEWASMGVSYLMADSCYYAFVDNPATQHENAPSDASVNWYANQLGLALQHAGQNTQFFISPCGSSLWGAECGCVGITIPNQIGDVGLPDYSVLMRVFDAQVPFAYQVAPGRWIQEYYLQIGGVLTVPEGRSAMALFCITAFPLFISTDLTAISDGDLATLLNTEVIAVDQDPLVLSGTRYVHEVAGTGFLDVWVKPLVNGKFALALLNRDDVPHSISVTWAGLSLIGPFFVRDLWSHTDLDLKVSGYTTTVGSHDSAMILLTPPAKPSPVIPLGGSAVARKSFSFFSREKESLPLPQYSGGTANPIRSDLPSPQIPQRVF